MINILFTCAGRRNYLINYFKEALNGRGSVIAADVLNSAPALLDADFSEIVPDVYDPGYIDCLLDLVKKHKVDAIISLNDLELPILSKNRERFETLGAKVLVADSEKINIAFDKWKTAKFIDSIGLNSPKTYLTLEDFTADLEKGIIDFPVVLKPRFGSASLGIEYPESMQELHLCHKLSMIKLGRSILKNASSKDLEHSMIIQEKLKGIEYGMDVLNDFDTNYVASFTRQKLGMRSGETDKAISVIDSKFAEVGKIIGNSFKHIGSMDCDLFVHEGQVFVLEMNPRFGGGYPFSHEAGANIAKTYVEWLKGNNNITHLLLYKEGLTFAKCDRLIQIS